MLTVCSLSPVQWKAEVTVKAAKKTINLTIFHSLDGNLDSKSCLGILQYQKIPMPDINSSLVQVLLCCQLWDSCCPADGTKSSSRSIMLRHIKNSNNLGTNVVVQGKDKIWDRTGCIAEVLSNRQYCIPMFHSGREWLSTNTVSWWNTKHLHQSLSANPFCITLRTNTFSMCHTPMFNTTCDHRMWSPWCRTEITTNKHCTSHRSTWKNCLFLLIVMYSYQIPQPPLGPLSKSPQH